jgi:hypothetical protein
VTSYKGFASNEKLGIQIWQNPASLKNSRICLLEVGVGIEQLVFFCAKFPLPLGDVKPQIFDLVLTDLRPFLKYLVISSP